jgi:glutaconyl-CoA/methylmalonyl-CoA decarboxylase subunit gamma
MKKYKFTIHGNQYEVNIMSVEDNIAELEVNGTVFKVEVDKTLQQTKTPRLVRTATVPSTDSHPAVAKTSAPSGAAGAGGHVKSPLPGVILDVFVKVGDTVKKGQKLLCLEAMKMENNIDSDKDGKVLKISANKGDSVMEGDILVTIG